jgi:predicted RNA-binding protein with PIN domain
VTPWRCRCRCRWDGLEQHWSVRWLVDGMNVIGARPDGWWRDRPAARRRLVAELGIFAGRPEVDAVAVVFDGNEALGEVAEAAAVGVEVSFAGRGADAADRVIAALVSASPDPHGVTVVTSDAALAAAVREAGAAVVGASVFRRDLRR